MAIKRYLKVIKHLRETMDYKVKKPASGYSRYEKIRIVDKDSSLFKLTS